MSSEMRESKFTNEDLETISRTWNSLKYTEHTAMLLASELLRARALLARTEAGADREDTHEYTLSGVLSYGAIAIKPEQGAVPSHLRNLLRQALGYLKIELEGRHAASVADGLYAWVRESPRHWERVTESDLSQPSDTQKMRADGWFPVYTHSHDASAGDDVTRLRRCLGFFASVIKSGEPWTETCQREYDAALSSPPKEPQQ